MSTLIDINIPYAGGNAHTTYGGDSSSQKNHIKAQGIGWCFFGGDNQRKIFSLRVQSDENYWFVEVSETDDLTSQEASKTVLYTKAIPSGPAGLRTNISNPIEMCKLSSSAVYIKIFTGSVGQQNDSEHYVAEIDESNGNEVTITNVTDQMPTWLRGGTRSPSGDTHMWGIAVHTHFMHYLEENKIVTYEASTWNLYGNSNFVERSWDPATKSLTNRIVCSAGTRDYSSRSASYQTEDYGYGVTWSFVPEMNKNGFTTVRPHADNVANLSNHSGYPVLSGRNADEEADGVNRSHWINVAVGRDGLIHFSMATNIRGATSSTDWWNHYYLDTNPGNQLYVITYNPADGSWGTTGRIATDTSLLTGRDNFSVWLPLNVMSYADYDADTPDNDLSGLNVTQNSRVCKTWINIGAAGVQVQGVERGSEQDHYQIISDTLPGTTLQADARALQAYWLDYDHFIVFSLRKAATWGGQDYFPNNVMYTIYRYYDENKIDHVSSGICGADSAGGPPTHTYVQPVPNVFQRISPTTFVSDKFTKLVSLSAGQG